MLDAGLQFCWKVTSSYLFCKDIANIISFLQTPHCSRCKYRYMQNVKRHARIETFFLNKHGLFELYQTILRKKVWVIENCINFSCTPLVFVNIFGKIFLVVTNLWRENTYIQITENLYNWEFWQVAPLAWRQSPSE